ncbi:MAG: DUF2490 domain-containing protein [Chitinophagaceae bacterium]|nr:DUF2490 domain-containing protein [Chitinophagaceae bacterium]
MSYYRFSTIRHTFHTLLVMSAMLSSTSVAAQPSRLGGWSSITLTYKTSPRLSYYVEVQERSQGVAKDFFYHEVKGGLSYTLPEKFTAMIATGDYHTYSNTGTFKNRLTREFRVWQQLALTTKITPLRIDHRYRIEQRWLNGNYRNRFRYRFNPVLPLNHQSIVARTLYLTMYDEVFFTNRSPYFERNRFFGGVGYQFSKLFAMQAGVILQFDYRPIDDGVKKNFLHASLLFFLDKNSDFDARQPNTLD